MATISRGAAAGHRRRTGGALFCSERHVRTLLRQAQEAGGCWQASSGRGKRGQLLFHKTPESLRNEMMEQALNNGQQQTALELAQLAPVELKALLHPFLGGQWQNNTPRCVFLTIARWSRCVPAFSRPRRAASGRTNLCRADALRRRRQYADRRSGAPLAGLPDGLRWHFISAPRCAGTMAIRWKPRSCDSGYCCCLSCPPCGPSSPASAVSMSPMPSV